MARTKTTLTQILYKLKHTIEQAHDLEEAYKSRVKGNNYIKRRKVIVERYKFYIGLIKDFDKQVIKKWHVHTEHGILTVYFSGHIKEDEIKSLIEIKTGIKVVDIKKVENIYTGIPENIYKQQILPFKEPE